MHIVTIGDIGPVDEMIHIGDEAMFDAAVRELRLRGVDRITAVTSNPADSVARYAVETVVPLSRGGSPDELAEVIGSADGVLVAGGGNVSSVWPSHIVERANLASIAAELDRPIVVSGQTIGPVLTDADRETVGRMLGSARLVGTRESASAALVTALGVPADRSAQNVDDASFLGDGDARAAAPPGDPYALVTLARHVGDVDFERALDAYARLLDAVAEQTDLELVFHAHFGSLRDDVRGDALVHAAVAERLRTARVRVVPPTDVPSSATLARSAALIVTSRYHPAVFAGPGGVPTIGIPVDEYTGVKLRGALGSFGQDGILPISRVLEHGGADTVGAVWDARAQTRERGIRIAGTARADSAAWWDRVLRAFGG
ncbi:MAG: polysaccharide pyruvyl transferase family protein [Actinomycetota bacterium]|nr:polysaccharide pyruvyl transferase family protein [Actinomycetota bacterium]